MTRAKPPPPILLIREGSRLLVEDLLRQKGLSFTVESNASLPGVLNFHLEPCLDSVLLWLFDEMPPEAHGARLVSDASASPGEGAP